ncbi:MAG: helix-turn-helix domain-containing protein [Pseudomonadota bacterium]
MTRSKRSKTANPVARRLRAIRLAERLGNVAESCRRSGMDRTSFYEWKRRYDAAGEAGLADRPSAHRHHPRTTPEDVSARIAALALKHPAYGCNRIEHELAGHAVSSTTVHAILRKSGLATRHDRWLALDLPFRGSKPPFTPEQMRFLATINPCWLDRGLTGSYPGEFLVHGAFPLLPKKEAKLVVHCAIDVLTSTARARLSFHRETQHAGACLKALHEHLEFDCGLPGTRTCTTYGHESHSRWLVRNQGWRHQRLPAATSRKVGAFIRFRRIVIAEFLPWLGRDFRTLSRYDVDDAMVAWTEFYNTARPHHGYPNYGRPPAETVAASVRKEA